MFSTTTYTLLLGSSLLWVPVPDPKPSRDEKLLQGSWRVVDFERNGSKMELMRLTTLDVMIKGNRWQWNSQQKGATTPVYELTLLPGEKPPGFNLTIVGAKTPSLHGIYQVDKDSLKLCYRSSRTRGSKRPTEFKSNEPGSILLLLKRQKS